MRPSHKIKNPDDLWSSTERSTYKTAVVNGNVHGNNLSFFPRHKTDNRERVPLIYLHWQGLGHPDKHYKRDFNTNPFLLFIYLIIYSMSLQIILELDIISTCRLSMRSVKDVQQCENIHCYFEINICTLVHGFNTLFFQTQLLRSQCEYLECDIKIFLMT